MGSLYLYTVAPGRGKTFTAGCVAEIAKKPPFRVTCRDIGAEPEQVEKELESDLSPVHSVVLALARILPGFVGPSVRISVETSPKPNRGQEPSHLGVSRTPLPTEASEPPRVDVHPIGSSNAAVALEATPDLVVLSVCTYATYRPPVCHSHRHRHCARQKALLWKSRISARRVGR